MLSLRERINNMEKDLLIYEKLYEIAQRNLENAGEAMQFTKEAFLYSVKCDLKNVNGFDMVQYSNETLLQVLYVAFFYRTPEENARINWGKLNEMTEKDFQKKIFQTLSSSQEYLRNGTIIYNNIFTTGTPKIGAPSLQSVQTNVYVEKAFTYYQRMPKILKRIIKSILGGTHK